VPPLKRSIAKHLLYNVERAIRTLLSWLHFLKDVVKGGFLQSRKDEYLPYYLKT
jgi:hypothetical protein